MHPGGSRSWVLRFQLNGRRRDMGLGSYPEISLARSREKAMDARRLIKEGLDPLAERGRTKALTFRHGGRGADREQEAGMAQRQARLAVGYDALDAMPTPAR